MLLSPMLNATILITYAGAMRILVSFIWLLMLYS